jgi:hypothetical protein
MDKSALLPGKEMLKNCFSAMLSACLLVMGNASAFADTAANYYLDATYWKDMDWSRPESSPLWQTPGWDQINGENIVNGGIIKERTIFIEGKKWMRVGVLQQKQMIEIICLLGSQALI